MRTFLVALKYNFLLVYRRSHELIQSLLFFVILIVLFPLAMGPDQHLLQFIGPGLILVATLLSMLLAMPQLFAEDFRDGCLEQQLLSPYPLSLFVFIRIVIHWLTTAFPLILLLPLLGVWLSIPLHTLLALILSLLVGTPIFSTVGAIMVALTLGLRQSGALLALLILPLIVPILISGAGITTLASQGQSYCAALAWLGAILAVALSVGPFVIGEALKVGIL